MAFPKINTISKKLRQKYLRKITFQPRHTLVVALGQTFQPKLATPHLGEAATVALNALPERFPDVYSAFTTPAARDPGRVKDQADILSKVAHATGRAAHDSSHGVTLMHSPARHFESGPWVRRVGDALVERHGLEHRGHLGLVLVNADERSRLGVVAAINALRPGDAHIHHPGLRAVRDEWKNSVTRTSAKARIAIGINPITAEEEHALYLKDRTPRSAKVFNAKKHAVDMTDEVRRQMQEILADDLHRELQLIMYQWREKEPTRKRYRSRGGGREGEEEEEEEENGEVEEEGEDEDEDEDKDEDEPQKELQRFAEEGRGRHGEQRVDGIQYPGRFAARHKEWLAGRSEGRSIGQEKEARQRDWINRASTPAR